MSDRLPIVNSSSSSSSSVHYRTPKIATAAAEWNPLDRALTLELMLPLLQAYTAAEAAEIRPQPHELVRYRYPTMRKTLNNFTLNVVEGEITATQIFVVLGKEGTGGTTFLELLARILNPDEVEGLDVEMPEFKVSYKPRNILFSRPCLLTVRDILYRHQIHDSCMMNPKFVCNVMEPLHINLLMDKVMKDLSPGELQSVALCLCLGKPADIYLIDIPSAFLDTQQLVATIKAIKWFIRHENKAVVVVDRHFHMASQLADRFIVIEGEPFVHCTANAPGPVLAGANLYLTQFDDEVQRRPIEFWLDLKKLELESTMLELKKLELESTTNSREQNAAGGPLLRR